MEQNLCSDYQIEELQNKVYLVGRNKTTNKHIMAAMLKVNQAIRENKKITFRYQKFTIKDRTQQVDRRGGATYKISPFKLIINDGYFTLDCTLTDTALPEMLLIRLLLGRQ